MTRGKFITFEGGEGTGKSTQVARLVSFLKGQDYPVTRTREPGGSPGAEAIRDLVVSGAADRWSPRTELLLMYAARSDHLERTIRPALEAGHWVVSDRFADSSHAYQGAGGGMASETIEFLDQTVVYDDQPDLTLIFDLPVEVGLERALARSLEQGQILGETRFESKGLAFHQRLRDAFRQIASAHPERCHLIDATGTPDAVFERVRHAVVSALI